MPDPEIIEVEIDEVLTPVEKADWEADQEAVIADVRHNREIMRAGGPDTTDEARQLAEDNALPEPEHDPTDFGHQTITSPPKAGEQ
jgi:hypothetical protein